MTDETIVCRICGTRRSCGEDPGAHPPDLCKACAFDRIDFAKAIVTGLLSNPNYFRDVIYEDVFKSAEEMLLESRKPRGES